MFPRNNSLAPILRTASACRWKYVFVAKYSSEKANKPKLLRDEDRVFSNLYGRHDWHLDAAMDRGDWYKTKEMLGKGPEWIINELDKSGVRGRGGAFYPLGKKLKYMQMINTPSPRYLVINGAEGEPGTCKDRDIIRHEPQKIIEGALLVGRAISAKQAWIFVRNTFFNEACNLQTALIEAYQAGLVGKNACGSGFDFDIFIQRGGGEYISGEETALIKCLMGSEARPTKKPPYPSQSGLWKQSTFLLNLETVSLVSTICRRGSKWYANLGVWPHSPGTKLFCISGNVEKPCTVEENLGIGLRDIIETHAGGVKGGWNNLQAIIPGGPSTSMLPKQVCNSVTLDAESLKAVKSDLGTGAIIVIDNSQDIMEVITNILYFYKVTSCHQCSRCRGQSTWGYELCHQFKQGIGHCQELDFLWDVSEWAPGKTICSFTWANSSAIQGFLRHFGGHVMTRLKQQMK